VGAPDFVPSAQGSAPVSRLLNNPSEDTGDTHVQSHELDAQAAVAWPSRPGSMLEPGAPHDYSANFTSVPFSSGVVALSSAGVSASSSWSYVDANVAAPVAASRRLPPGWHLATDRAQERTHTHRITQVNPVYEAEAAGLLHDWGLGRAHAHVISQMSPTVQVTTQQFPQEWPSMEDRAQDRVHAQNFPQMSTILSSEATSRSNTSTANGQGDRRAGNNRRPPTISSSFIARQPKNKVSKRSGPLLKAQRDKTHRMRQLKSICLRCKFYKNRVCTAPH
jgi:hypothetical protein